MVEISNLNNWAKFKLLLWKNWMTQMNHKRSLLFQLMIPLILMQVAVLVLHSTSTMSVIEEVTHFPPLNLTQLPVKTGFQSKSSNADNIDLPNPVLLYSPNISPNIDTIVRIAADSLQLKYRGYASAEELTKALSADNFLVGIQFHDVDDYPMKVSFDLRFPSELRTSQHKDTWMTMRLFPKMRYLGPRNVEEADGGHPVCYLREGFLAIQHALSMAYIRSASKANALPEVILQRYPYPPWAKGTFVHMSGKVLTVITMLSIMYPCVCVTKFITAEKENWTWEITKIMGLYNWLHWTAWFILAFLGLTVSIVLILLITKIEWIDGCMLSNSNFILLLFFMLIYLMSSITLCFMTVTFFNKAGTAAAAFGLFWLMSFIPYELLSVTNEQWSLNHLLFSCLFSNTALGLGFAIIADYERIGDGLQWSNVLEPVSLDEQLTLGAIILMMCLSAVIKMLICLYVEQVFPGKDVKEPRKWYFPLVMFRFCGRKSQQVERVMRIESYIGHDNYLRKKVQNRSHTFEAEPVGKSVGIKVQNLEKMYGQKKAVKNVTINIYQDEITVLLGHKGAGKTTLLSMLTGMITPTAGTAFINGCEIVANKKGARMFLGICPTHNVVFDDLSAVKNIEFFSRLKGLEGDAIQKEIQKYLMMTDLKNTPDLAALNLPVGMKRMLAVCCTLCAGSKVVVFDEPSSIMSSSERRQLWHLLQAEKSGRTVLLATHALEEADILSDRIVILSNGSLKCYGTSFFLKKKYGTGYVLTCVKEFNCDVDEVTKLLRQFVPGVLPIEGRGSEFSYKISDRFSESFEAMFKALEDNSDSLGIKSFGLSLNSMADVFLKVGTDILQRISTHSNEFNLSDEELENVLYESKILKSRHFHWGLNLYFNQWKAMFMKRCLCSLRNIHLPIILITLPLVVVVLTVLMSKFNDFNSKLPPMTMGLKQYPFVVTILDRHSLENMSSNAIEMKIANQYQSLAELGSNYILTTTDNSSFSEYILNLGASIQNQIDTNYLAAATIQVGKIIAWLNNSPLHTAPLTLNLVHNAIARALIDTNAEISITNSPLPYEPNERFDRIINGYNFGNDLAMVICLTMCIVSALFTISLIKERICRSKLLQFVSGAGAWTFWLTQLIWDMIIFTVVALVIVMALASFRITYFSSFSELGPYFLVLFVFGLSMLPLMYLLSFLFEDPYSGCTCIGIINTFCGIALFIFSSILHLTKFIEASNNLRAIFRIYPHFSLVSALNKIYINTATHSVCRDTAMMSLSPSKICSKVPQCCDLVPYFGYKTPGICLELIYLSFTAVIYFCIIILCEHGAIKNYIKTKMRRKYPQLPTEDLVKMDSDVWMEKQHVNTLTNFEKVGKNVVLDRVSKFYGSYLVVNQVSLCVRRMECIGLLGTIGAGRTTLMKMITGDEHISSGSVHIRGYNINKDQQAVYNMIGYCPQINPLFDELTGREHLKIFCLLRGTSRGRIDFISESLAKSFGFMNHLDKLTKDYSIANRRKLTTALAVLGKPAVILLDEPSTGMDPIARQQLWDFLKHLRDSGKSIVLISNNMLECERLCNRLIIMVNGELKCMGSAHHLKKKFSKSIILKLKVRVNPDYLRQVTSPRLLNEEKTAFEMSKRKIERVKDMIDHQYTQAKLETEYYGVLTYRIPLRSIKWSQIFHLLENNLKPFEIEDYTISQMTLEDILLELGKNQDHLVIDEPNNR